MVSCFKTKITTIIVVRLV